MENKHISDNESENVNNKSKISMGFNPNGNINSGI